MDSILEVLPENVKVKIGQCTLAKEIWDNVQLLYIVKVNEDS